MIESARARVWLWLLWSLCWCGGVPARDEVDPRADSLQRTLQDILASKTLQGATIGIEARSISRHTMLFQQHADSSLIPASNLKLVTLALSLHLLGANHHFDTPLFASGPVDAHGVVQGDLWIVGSGDPTLSPPFFESEDDDAALLPFVQAIREERILGFTGDLVVDDRAFDDVFVHPSWPAEQLALDYCAPVAALSLNGNCFSVWVNGTPGARLAPEASGFRLHTELKLAQAPKECSVSVSRPDESGEILVRGNIGRDVAASRIHVPVIDPPLFFGEALKSRLQRDGVTVHGRVRRPAPEEVVSERWRELYRRRSPLLPAIHFCGKESDNFIAEHLLRACAVASGRKGTFEDGSAVAREFLAQLGANVEPVTLVDGSGLSRDNRMSPAALARLLEFMYEGPSRDEYVRALPISGVDGTLEKRMNDEFMRSRVRAKTGFIRAVSSLSGYVMAGSREAPEVIAFSILVNGFKGSNSSMKEVQNRVCRALAELGS